LASSSPSPDVAPITQLWNLPDLLVGLDGLHRLQTSPPEATNDVASTHSMMSSPPSPTNILQPSSNILNNSSLELSKSFQNEPRPNTYDSFRNCPDSILEGLGILPTTTVSPVKTEPSPLNTMSSLDSLELEITPFELSLKSEPGMNSMVNISNLSSLSSISCLDILNSSKVDTPLNVDSLVTQHCTLLPPEIISDQGVLLPAALRTANFVATVDDITDQPLSEVSHSFLHQDCLKEEEEIYEKPVEIEANPTYKRCHLCVRIFSTKANLSSHIRHVHLGETKHSRVKSIPCPHCHKMFSRKGHMTEHVRTVHEGKKRIYKEVNCQHCGKTFRRKWGLNIHISSAHADVVSSLLKP